MFIHIDDGGQLVGVDIILSGKLDTPILDTTDSYESTAPSFQTPQGPRVNVIHITWQVQTKLTTWFGRRKDSAFQDLEFLFLAYGNEIVKWSQYLDHNMRVTFYEVYNVATEDNVFRDAVKKALCL